MSFFKDEFQKFKFKRGLVKAGRLAGKVASVLDVAADVPASGPVGLVRAGSRILSSVIDTDKEAWDIAGRKEVVDIGVAFLPFCLDLISRQCTEKTSTKEYSIYALPGMNIWKYEESSSHALRVERHNKDESGSDSLFSFLGRALWEEYGRTVSLSCPYDAKVRRVVFRAKSFDSENVLSSSQSVKITKRLREFKKQGKNRFILLHGPPGTGKSEMAKYICSRLDGFTLFFDADSFRNCGVYDLKMLLAIACPDNVIIDDFDLGAADAASMISVLGAVRETGASLIATANELSAIDSAVRRAGRIDEVYLMDRIVSAKDIIPGLTEAQYEILDEWPVAFTRELQERLAVLGSENLESEIEALAEREKDNEEYRRMITSVIKTTAG